MNNQNKHVYALGIGHNTPVFIDLAESCGFKVVGLYHYEAGKTGDYCYGIRVIGSFDDLFSKNDLEGLCFLLTMGDNNIRANLLNRIISKGGIVPTMIHPTAVVSRFSKVSSIAVYISPFSYIEADCEIGCNTIILSHVDICHTSKIGCNCFIAGGCTIGAYTIMEDYVFVGQGVLSVSGKVGRIGRQAYIGAGSLLLNEVEVGSLVFGRPAKKQNINV